MLCSGPGAGLSPPWSLERAWGEGASQSPRCPLTSALHFFSRSLFSLYCKDGLELSVEMLGEPPG